MILLDTNVVSDLLRGTGPGPVHAWLDRQDPRRIWTSAITLFELRQSIERLAAGARRRALERNLSLLLGDALLAGRVVPLDQAAAEAAGRLAAERFRRGRPVELADTLIAGIALARQAALATRNTRHFEDAAGLVLIDPWSA